MGNASSRSGGGIRPAWSDELPLPPWADENRALNAQADDNDSDVEDDLRFLFQN